MTASWIENPKKHLEDLKTPVSSFYRMINKAVDLERWMDFRTVLMCAMARNFNVTGIQSHMWPYWAETAEFWKQGAAEVICVEAMKCLLPFLAQSETGASSSSPAKTALWQRTLWHLSSQIFKEEQQTQAADSALLGTCWGQDTPLGETWQKICWWGDN